MKLRVAIVGIGGLGVPCAWQLVRTWDLAAELNLILIDPDTVALDNLNRQVLYRTSDREHPKASVLKQRLSDPQFPPSSKPFHIESRQESLTFLNIGRLLEGVDYVVDGTDSVETKFLLNDYCKALQIPLCYGGAVGLSGLVLPIEPKLQTDLPVACLRCVFGDFTQSDYDCSGPTCRQAGILGSVAGVIGALQAQQVYLWFRSQELGKKPPEQRLIRLSGETLQVTESQVQASQDCPLGCLYPKKTTLNLLDKVCPQTFLFTKLALEQLPEGELLDVRLKDLETATNVARSSQEDGYSVLGKPHPISQNVVQLFIARKT